VRTSWEHLTVGVGVDHALTDSVDAIVREGVDAGKECECDREK
jgi:hypothetical protein